MPKRTSLKKIWAIAILGAAGAVGNSNAIAEDNNNSEVSNLSFTFSIASRHIQQRQFNSWDNPSVKKDFNEFNPGLIVNYKLSKFSNSDITTNISAGAYKNSFYETTYMASASIETNNSKFMGKRVDFGVEAGLTHGYKDGSGKKFPVFPMGQIFVSTEINKELDFRVGLIPMSIAKPLLPDDAVTVDIITASVVWKPKF